MLKSLLFATLILTITSGAFALDIPKGAPRDGRIKKVIYVRDDVVRVDAFIGIGTQIVFAEDEEIKDYGSGFSEAWEFVKRGNVFYLKPKLENADTNLHIVTNRHAYAFELRLHKDWMAKRNRNLPYDPKMTFRIEFVYPDDDAKRLQMLADIKEVKTRMNTKNIPRNWNYTMHVGKASREIAPTMAYDDGRFTYLKFPNNREIPALFLVSDDKKESLVNTHVIDDTVVIQRVAKQFYLRLGNLVIGLYNESYDPDGVAPKNGTTVNGMKRTIKGGQYD